MGNDKYLDHLNEFKNIYSPLFKMFGKLITFRSHKSFFMHKTQHSEV